MQRLARHTVLGLLALTMLVGCDDPPPANLAESPKVATPAAKRRPRAKRGSKPAPAQAAPKFVLAEADFQESPRNRDPFRSYIREFFTVKRRQFDPTRPVLLKSYGLDELKLMAIITGQVRPRAMFKDPNGLGVTVKRGDYVSKSAAKVKAILADKIIVQIEEQLEGGQRVAERTINLHSKDKLIK